MAINEPVSLLKIKIDCPCGCGLFGTPRKKVWAGEIAGHVRACKCTRCSGGRQVARSRKRENRIAKELGGTRDPGSGRVTGIDIRVGETVWIEETANKALVAGIRRWWEGKGTTTKLARLRERRAQMGVPIAFVGSWEGKARVAVMDYDDFTQLIKMAKDNQQEYQCE